MIDIVIHFHYESTQDTVSSCLRPLSDKTHIRIRIDHGRINHYYLINIYPSPAASQHGLHQTEYGRTKRCIDRTTVAYRSVKTREWHQ